MPQMTLQQAFDLALQHQRAGRLAEAEQIYRQILAAVPQNFAVLQNLAGIVQQTGRLEDAIQLFREAVSLNPTSAEAYSNLANALNTNGRLDDSISACRQAISLNPNFAEAHGNLGNALRIKGDLDESISASRRAIELKPNSPQAHNNLGAALAGKGQFDEAIDAFRQALALRPDFPGAMNNLANALREAGQYDESISLYRSAIALAPDQADAHNNLAIVLGDLGLPDQSLAAHRRSVQLKNDSSDYHCNLLFELNYQHAPDAREIFNAHRAWAERFASPPTAEITSHPNDRDPGRTLRIGYVSADFARHSVAYFLIPLLEHHDHQAVEIFCYSNVTRPDDFTQRIQRSAAVWRDITAASDEAAAQTVRADRIDILVDLSGHTAGRRPLIFARKPAPIQITYLGYPNTTGMTAIDYRLTDSLADPPGLTHHLNTEKLWRLPTCAWCYQPPDDSPVIRPRPEGPITFGCFNALAKINPHLTALWADLLKKTPNSRLFLKSSGISALSSQRRLISEFNQLGIPAERIELQGRTSDSIQHLDLYNRVDVALDTYPYHGTTTTCEALWMGVPVVTLAGQNHLSRVGVSLLANIGLPDLIADSESDYIRIAVSLANDPARLSHFRTTLRAQIQSSPLMDAPRFAADIESAYRQMWRIYCSPG
jgi:protein O-GlcNAc transferase